MKVVEAERTFKESLVWFLSSTIYLVCALLYSGLWKFFKLLTGSPAYKSMVAVKTSPP